MRISAYRSALLLAVTATVTLPISAASAGGAGGASAEHARIVSHWTPERRAAAIPRDLVIDERGYGYLRKPNGSLEPYGHTVAASTASQRPMAKPVPGDTVGPSVSGMNPAAGTTIGTSYTFKANVTDDKSGIRSVSFRVGPKGGIQQSFSASGSNGLYTVQLSGFSNGQWTWSVVAKDTSNNTTTTSLVEFTVNTSGGGGGGGTVVTNAAWTGGVVQTAAGRIYFEMPSNSRRTRWAGYVCSGTVVDDGATGGRSIIQTAAHCVYDDAYKAFARNVLFIPNQAATTGTGTDLSCTNDPLGCWTPAFGVVDDDWTTRTFPDNVAWDYAYYVVNDAGSHFGNGGGANLVLESTAGALTIKFDPPTVGAYTHALGYSYSEDPKFMYCAENLANLDAANWWLGNCGLSGGSSGGPWLQPVDSGNGPLISVNSWGYTNQPGMAGPKLSGTSAQCVFATAKSSEFFPTEPVDGEAGYDPGCP